MDLQSIVSELKKERERLNQAIEALNGTGSQRNSATPTQSRVASRGPRKHHLTAAGRRRLSMLMKRRWAERRRRAS